MLSNVSSSRSARKKQRFLSYRKEKVQGFQTPSKDLRTREEIKTLRRRVVQADKETEEMKQKMQEYQNKYDEVAKQEGGKNKEILQLQEKLEQSEKRVSELEKEFQQS